MKAFDEKWQKAPFQELAVRGRKVTLMM